jgi:hypothetical protein
MALSFAQNPKQFLNANHTEKPAVDLAAERYPVTARFQTTGQKPLANAEGGALKK